MARMIVCLTLVTCASLAVRADSSGNPRNAAAYVPDLTALSKSSSSELRDVVERYTTDRAALLRRFAVANSPVRRDQMRAFYTAWRDRTRELNFNALGQDGRVDYLLLKERLASELDLLAREEKNLKETTALVPFAEPLIQLQEARRRMETIDPAAAARILDRVEAQVIATRIAVEAGATKGENTKTTPDAGTDVGTNGSNGARPARTEASKDDVAPIRPTRIVAYRAGAIVDGLRETLDQWFKYYAGYDPLFTWWATAPYKKTEEELKSYAKVLREKVVGYKDGEDEPIVGDPIGRDAIVADLAHEMIPYTPEELITIAEREFAWCEAELKRAARDMGLGDDWRAAVEKVKSLHVEPGRQADLIRDQAREAIEFVEKHDLVTVPPLAKDIWRIEMMSPARQKENPFFLGGEVIQVSFPTDTMDHEDKLMSMRGNNVHFARATVHHELIPGHHLQGFMTDRYNTHRRAFSTSFWTEGWSLYWEMLLWDLQFPQSPENRVGMLFWRAHRAARIIFSLNFHLGKMTPEECIDFLVTRVGHERANATAEVRRSFNGNYGPLYQVAYMIGGLQIRSLHRELVQSGRMTNREFHDAILRGGRVPIEMVRAMLTNAPLTQEYRAQWRFAGQ